MGIKSSRLRIIENCLIGNLDIKYHSKNKRCLPCAKSKRDVKGKNKPQDIVGFMNSEDINLCFLGMLRGSMLVL